MEYLERRVAMVNDRLKDVTGAVEPPALSAEVEHVALAGGKRVRPTVTLLACEAAGGDAQDAVDFAVGVELVHNASLVVDDIIDRSEVRRNTPSAWAEYGHGPALIASDGLLGEAFGLFSSDERAMQVVSDAERVGVAFQIRDDVLDATADGDALGKPTGQDEAMDRPSVLQVTDLTPEAANERARTEADEALAALETAGVGESDARGYLRDLAEFVVVRER